MRGRNTASDALGLARLYEYIYDLGIVCDFLDFFSFLEV